MSGFRRRPRPVVPGETCPAERTAWHNDPKVQITGQRDGMRFGTRTCGRCGRPGVKVKQHHGDVWTAWQYEMHTVPVKE